MRKRNEAGGQNSENVIQLDERRPALDSPFEPSGSLAASKLRLRLDMEQAKIAISTSLISVVVLVTFANNSIWSSGPSAAVALPGGEAADHSRSIASLNLSPEASRVDSGLAQRLASAGLAEGSGIGRAPSSLDQLALGFLEGKYSLRLERGKLHGLEFSSDSATGDSPKFVDRVRFLEQNRDLLPVAFDRLSKASSDEGLGVGQVESYELLRDGVEAPLARVEFRMDTAGRLLSMKVRMQRFAVL